MFFLGSITGSSGSYSNQQTGASGVGTFVIPPGTQALYLFPSATGILFEMALASGFTGSTFQTTPARGAPLQPNQVNGPYPCMRGQNTVVGISSTTSGVSVRVYATFVTAP